LEGGPAGQEKRDPERQRERGAFEQPVAAAAQTSKASSAALTCTRGAWYLTDLFAIDTFHRDFRVNCFLRKLIGKPGRVPH
jgi:hypothetical protein